MDGRGRLLRSLEVGNIAFPPAALSSGALTVVGPALRESAARGRKQRRGPGQNLLALLGKPGAALLFSLAFLAAVSMYGMVKGGHYAAFVAAHGGLADFLAKKLGFAIQAVTVSGTREVPEKEILAAAGIGPRNSLLFLDAAKARENLKRLPGIKEASITKLYPSRLLIEIEERRPFALWQNGGETKIVAEDGVVLGPFLDRRFVHLPLVAGEGANEKIGEYVAILDAAGGALREHIIAGVRVGLRRWTLKTDGGTDVLLPERQPETAAARLAGLQRLYHILDKDILLIDLRQPDRLAVRLSEEAAAARAGPPARNARARGGRG
ncbi:MAG: FtsQ-type POTRA domain-containing protein [Methylocapsa sp.]|nr:FtsQ-type POTRA domain-containing protein [Methylocapsa sp.]